MAAMAHDHLPVDVWESRDMSIVLFIVYMIIISDDPWIIYYFFLVYSRLYIHIVYSTVPYYTILYCIPRYCIILDSTMCMDCVYCVPV